MLRDLTIRNRESVLDGRAFGDAGPYESVYGRATFAVDPAQACNARVVDLDRAPRGADGLVECSADIWILKPVQPDLGNGALLAHIVNRGRKGVLQCYNLAEGSNHPVTEGEYGDGFLMRHGFTVAACAWQADVPLESPDDKDLMTLDVPVAGTPEGPITGPVASEIVVDARSTLESLGSRHHRPYEPFDMNEPGAVLTVRSAPGEPHEIIARERWALDRLPDGRPAARFDEGFEPGRIYNVVYTARDPRVMGLGFVTTRDFISHLRYGSAASDVSNPLDGAIRRALCFGSSQSGRFMRHLLYQGFNEDASGRRVIDGMVVNVAGAGMGSFNHRFAQPSRHACAHTDTLYLTEQFPFTDDPQVDVRSGRREGLLDRAHARNCAPRIFYTNTSVEYWNRGASLIHTTTDGAHDVDPPDNVRVYHFTGTQHSPGDLPAPGTVLPANPVNFRLAHRALLLALDAWVDRDVSPPPSRYATIHGGTLTDPPSGGGRFQNVAGVPYPRAIRHPAPLDFGPNTRHGILDREPPEVGTPWVVRVPAVDRDGNELAGLTLPEVAVPLGTFTGWRYRAEGTGAPNALAGLQGMWIPFAATRKAREATRESRPSIEERYASEDAYIALIRESAEHLVESGYLCEDDIPLAEDRARRMYRWATSRR